MKNITITVALAFGLGVLTSAAQPHPGGPGGPGGFGGPRGHGPRQLPPIMVVLDANTNAVIEAEEIANSSAALLTLDANSDGKLSAEELMPPPPPGMTNQFRAAPPQGAKRPAPPIMTALDVNQDGVLDAEEIANASAALLTLDVTGDGQLTLDEIRPPHPGGPGGQANGDFNSQPPPPGAR